MSAGERIKIVHMRREEIINCHCGFREEDGLMVQCELCLCWQHALCHNIQKESEVTHSGATPLNLGILPCFSNQLASASANLAHAFKCLIFKKKIKYTNDNWRYWAVVCPA